MTSPLDDFPKGAFTLGVAIGIVVDYFALELFNHGNGTLDAAELAFGLVVSQRGSWIVIGPALYGVVAVAIALGESVTERLGMLLLAGMVHYGTVAAKLVLFGGNGLLGSQFPAASDMSGMQWGFTSALVAAHVFALIACFIPLLDKWRFRERPRGW